jgi:hypothetical protein
MLNEKIDKFEFTFYPKLHYKPCVRLSDAWFHFMSNSINPYSIFMLRFG